MSSRLARSRSPLPMQRPQVTARKKKRVRKPNAAPFTNPTAASDKDDGYSKLKRNEKRCVFQNTMETLVAVLVKWLSDVIARGGGSLALPLVRASTQTVAPIPRFLLYWMG